MKRGVVGGDPPLGRWRACWLAPSGSGYQAFTSPSPSIPHRSFSSCSRCNTPTPPAALGFKPSSRGVGAASSWGPAPQPRRQPSRREGQRLTPRLALEETGQLCSVPVQRPGHGPSLPVSLTRVLLSLRQLSLSLCRVSAMGMLEPPVSPGPGGWKLIPSAWACVRRVRPAGQLPGWHTLRTSPGA